MARTEHGGECRGSWALQAITLSYHIRFCGRGGFTEVCHAKRAHEPRMMMLGDMAMNHPISGALCNEGNLLGLKRPHQGGVFHRAPRPIWQALT